MKQMTLALALAAALFTVSPAHATPPCDARDNAELCALSNETLAENPTFAQMRSEGPEGERDRATRHASRRARVREILDHLADPTWRDLYRAGYIIAYGDTPEEDLLAHAIAIRALSLAPDEADARFLVAMTMDEIGRRYVGAQLYGRQKYFEFDPRTGALIQSCLPQMIDPPLPTAVGSRFHRVDGFVPCPVGVGEIRPHGRER